MAVAWRRDGAGQSADEMFISGRKTESVSGLGFPIANFESRIGRADGEAAKG